MALDILMMNVRYLENVEISMLQPSLLRTSVSIPYLGKGPRKTINHASINNVVDEIRIIESKKVSAVNHEAWYFLEIDNNENGLYQVESMSLDETTEKLNDVSVGLNKKVHMLLKTEMEWYVYIIIK